jgi:hypothetical protein
MMALVSSIALVATPTNGVVAIAKYLSQTIRAVKILECLVGQIVDG